MLKCQPWLCGIISVSAWHEIAVTRAAMQEPRIFLIEKADVGLPQADTENRDGQCNCMILPRRRARLAIARRPVDSSRMVSGAHPCRGLCPRSGAGVNVSRFPSVPVLRWKR